MGDYQHVLLATDLGEQSVLIGQRALDIARHYQARASVLHVVDYLPSFGIGSELVLPTYPEIEEQLVKQAQQQLHGLLQKLNAEGIVEDHFAMGSPPNQIARFAAEQHVDLIVIGRHSRHGIGLLLGSTANAILESALCDVLAVKV